MFIKLFLDTCHIINFIRFNRIHNLTMTIPAIFLPPTDQIINPILVSKLEWYRLQIQFDISKEYDFKTTH